MTSDVDDSHLHESLSGPGCVLRTKVLLPTCIHLLVSDRLVEVSFSVSMSPRSVAVVVGSVYSQSDPLLVLGFLWFSREASAWCLGGVPDSVFGVTSLAAAVWFWKP